MMKPTQAAQYSFVVVVVRIVMTPILYYGNAFRF